MFSLQQFFSYVPLTETVVRVMGGIPRVLPEGFYNLTRDIPGDRFRRATFRGTRKLAKVGKYGAPPRNVERVGRGMEDRVMLHTVEQIQASHELLMTLRKWDDYMQQQLARDLIREDTAEFARRQDNLRVAGITASLAYGKIWVDADGDLQLTSAGADLELDYLIPDTNRNQVNLGEGDLITDSWDDPEADIPTMVNNLRSRLRMVNGYEIKHAFYTKNVAGCLARNNSFQKYLSRNPQRNQQYVNTGQIPDGVLDLTWIPVQDAFFDDENGTTTQIFPAGQVTFYPEVSRTTYELVQGGYPVPKEFVTAASLDALVNSVDYVYGPFQFAYMMPGLLQMNMVRGDTFLPDHKIPASVVLAEVIF